MKYTSLLLIGLMFFTGEEFISAQANTSTSSPDKSVNILISQGLNDLAESWASDFTQSNPAVSIKLLGEVAVSAENSEIIRISEDSDAKGQWKMIIGHDAIVSVTNSDNPLLDKITSQGVSANGFARLLSASGRPAWDNIIDGGPNTAVSLYYSDETAMKSIVDFSGTDNAAVKAIKLPGAQDLFSAIRKDKFAIGFCRLSDLYLDNSGEPAENITLLPIDKNGNRRIDYFENIYKTQADFLRGVWIGKYPDELSGSIYASSGAKPTNEAAISFLTWILTDGGVTLNRNGYGELAGIEKATALNALRSVPANRVETREATVSWLFILTGLLIISLLLVLIKTITSKKPAYYESDIKITPALDENSVAAPRGLFFDKTHTWAFMEKDGKVRMGVDDFLQHLTGKLTGVSMKEAGEKVVRGEKIFTIIHDGKHLDIHSPVTGIIKERNTALLADSSLINSSPYSEGWVYMIEPRNWLRETEFLFMSEKYREWLRSEFLRLKDFIATAIRSDASAYEQVILQDGGQITGNVLADMGPEVWEDFQTKFIDGSR